MPNLFDWATSELSQDAFLCWLIAHAGVLERGDLDRLARSFIAWLWNRARQDAVCEPQQVVLCKPPRKQRAHTDIFFSARLGKRHVLFLIEDKVRTSHHGTQLKRYAEWIEEQKIELGADDVLKVYFKTGYHFDEDLAVTQRGYLLVGLDDIVAFLGAHTAASEILDCYRSYVDVMQLVRRMQLRGHLALGTDFVQYDFPPRAEKSLS